MNHLLDSDLEERRTSGTAADREISLGTGTILGIFFALALICALFFGFGYSLGRKSGQNAATATITAPAASSTLLKPTAGSLAGRTSAATPLPAQQVVVPTAPAPVPTPKNGLLPSDSIIAGDKLPAPRSLQPAISPAGNFMVQIAAVSSQEIADIEVTALKRYGYEVAVRHEPQDQLLHIQIGPFATRKDAEAMRANVQSHGFNAIIK